MPLSPALAHLIMQTRVNVEFLIAQEVISPTAGRDILDRLPAPKSSRSHTKDQSNILITPPNSLPSLPSSPAGIRYSAPPAPAPVVMLAKAVWNYNDDGSDPADLSFRAGDIIEVIAETNSDWWTGRFKGHEGLFPSNYVEKIERATEPPPFPAIETRHQPHSYSYQSSARFQTRSPSRINYASSASQQASPHGTS